MSFRRRRRPGVGGGVRRRRRGVRAPRRIVRARRRTRRLRAPRASPDVRGLVDRDVRGADGRGGVDVARRSRRRGARVFEDSADFEFVVGAEVRSLSPASGPSSGGTVVHVASEHAADRDGAGPACRFGVSPPHDAAFVSSALVRCESPASDEGSSAVEVSDDEARVSFSESGVRFAFAAAARPMGHLGAASSDERGGALIRVVVAETLDAGATTCRVGTLAPIAARDAAPRETQCVAPARAPGVVDLDLASNLVDVTGAPLAFAYARALRVHSVVPASAAAAAKRWSFAASASPPPTRSRVVSGTSSRPRENSARSTARRTFAKKGEDSAHASGGRRSRASRRNLRQDSSRSTSPAPPTRRDSKSRRSPSTLRRASSPSRRPRVQPRAERWCISRARTRATETRRCARSEARPSSPRASRRRRWRRARRPRERRRAAAAAMIDGGMVESPAVFEFLPATRVLSVAPDVGSELGGGAFVIAGANLAPGASPRLAPSRQSPRGSSRKRRRRQWRPRESPRDPRAFRWSSGPSAPVRTRGAWTARGTRSRDPPPRGGDAGRVHDGGGAMVVLFGSGMYRQGDAPWACRFGDVRVDAVETSHRLPAEACAAGRCLGWSAVACAVPPGPPGFTTLGVAVGAETPFRNDVEFAFDVAAAVATGFPNESPSEGEDWCSCSDPTCDRGTRESRLCVSLDPRRRRVPPRWWCRRR